MHLSVSILVQLLPLPLVGNPLKMFYMNKANINLSYSSLNLLIITVVYQMVMMAYAGIMFLLNHEFIMTNLHGIQYFLMFSVTINLFINDWYFISDVFKKIYLSINLLSY